MRKNTQSMLSDISESERDDRTIKAKHDVKKAKRHSSEKKTVHATHCPIHKQHANRLTSSRGQLSFNSINEPRFEESRSFNSEICMNLTQLSNKLDAVLNEISSIKSNSAAVLDDQTYLQNKLLELEKSSLSVKNKEKLKTLSANVENLNLEIEILQDANSSLQSTIEKLNQHIEKQNETINDLEINKLLQEETIQAQETELGNYEVLKRENENYKNIINDFNAGLPQNSYVKSNEGLKKSDKDCHNVETQKFKFNAHKVRFNVRKPSDILTRTKTNSKQLKHTMSVMYQNILR